MRWSREDCHGHVAAVGGRLGRVTPSIGGGLVPTRRHPTVQASLETLQLLVTFTDLKKDAVLIGMYYRTTSCSFLAIGIVGWHRVT